MKTVESPIYFKNKVNILHEQPIYIIAGVVRNRYH